jgi:hypothetical protein
VFEAIHIHSFTKSPRGRLCRKSRVMWPVLWSNVYRWSHSTAYLFYVLGTVFLTWQRKHLQQKAPVGR